MENTRRREVYLRDRSELTTAQRRRLAKHEARTDAGAVPRASRMRKDMERRTRVQLRADGAYLARLIRGGALRPKNQQRARSEQTITTMRGAIARQKRG